MGMQIDGTRTPPSRRNKRQIVAYLSPDLVAAAHRHVEARNTTVQEFIGEAVNEAFSAYGRKPVMSLGHLRVVKRKKARAQVRTEDKVPACRTGRKALSGWYDERQVDAVAMFATEIGVRIQNLVEFGAKRIIERDTLPVAAE